jgi:hypothetical protein
MQPGTVPADRSDERQREATAGTMLRAQTRYYERHVLAWYALGRAQDARAAWDAVGQLRGRLASARAAADRGARAGRGCWREPNSDGIRTSSEHETRSGAYHPHQSETAAAMRGGISL